MYTLMIWNLPKMQAMMEETPRLPCYFTNCKIRLSSHSIKMGNTHVNVYSGIVRCSLLSFSFMDYAILIPILKKDR